MEIIFCIDHNIAFNRHVYALVERLIIQVTVMENVLIYEKVAMEIICYIDRNIAFKIHVYALVERLIIQVNNTVLMGLFNCNEIKDLNRVNLNSKAKRVA